VNGDEIERVWNWDLDVSRDEVKRLCAALGIQVTKERVWRWGEGFLQCSIHRMLQKRGRVECLKPLNL
jgi:hypothetical protein